MGKKIKMTQILSVIICLLPMILGAVLYNKLPEQIGVHFTVNNAPDNYAHKNFALFAIPLIMAAFQALSLISVNVRLNKLKNIQRPKILKIMEWFIPVLTVAIYVIMVEASLGSTVYVGKSVCLVLGILFVIIGNYLPKMSYEMGKTMFHPTPKNEKSFRKMSRIMGYSFIVMGVIFLIMIIWV